jgi:hypothetical protein
VLVVLQTAVLMLKGKVVEYLENPFGIGGMYWDVNRNSFDRTDSRFRVTRASVSFARQFFEC